MALDAVCAAGLMNFLRGDNYSCPADLIVAAHITTSGDSNETSGR